MKKFLAIFVCVLMTITTISFGGYKVNAESNLYDFSGGKEAVPTASSARSTGVVFGKNSNGWTDLTNASDYSGYDYVIFTGATKAGVDSSSKDFSSVGGDSYTVRFNTQGTLKYNSSALQVTLTATSTVTLYNAAGGAGRYLIAKKVENNALTGDDIVGVITDMNGNPVETSATTQNTQYVVTFENLEAGTYQFGSKSSGNYIYGFKVETSGGSDPVAPTSFALDTTIAGNVTNEADWDTGSSGWHKYKGSSKLTQSNGVFSYYGTGTKVQVKDDGSQIQLGGAANTNGQATIEVKVPSDYSEYVLKINWSSKNSSAAQLKYVEVVDGTLTFTDVKNASSSGTSDVLDSEITLKPGSTYRIGASNGMSIYSMTLEKSVSKNVSLVVKYDGTKYATVTGKYDLDAEKLGTLVDEEETYLFTEKLDASKLSIEVASDNTWDGSSDLTVTLSGMNILVKNGDTTVCTIPYAYVKNPVSGNTGSNIIGNTLQFKSTDGTISETTVVDREGNYSINLTNGYEYNVTILDSTTYQLEDVTLDLTNKQLGENVTLNITPTEIPVTVTHPEKVSVIPQLFNTTTGKVTAVAIGQTLEVASSERLTSKTAKVDTVNFGAYVFGDANGNPTTALNSLEADITIKDTGSNDLNYVGLGLLADNTGLDAESTYGKYTVTIAALRNSSGEDVQIATKSVSEFFGKNSLGGKKNIGTTVHIKVTRTSTGYNMTLTYSDGSTFSKDYKYGITANKTGVDSANTPVYFMLTASGASASVTNIVYKDSNGNVLYDQNEYYDPYGKAPVITSVSAVAAEDRTKIDVSWQGDVAKYDGKYVLEVLKPNSTTWEVLEDELTVNSYEYKVSVGEGGNYKFRVCGTLGNSEALNIANRNTPVESAIAYIRPALDTPVLVLDYVSSTEGVNLSWQEVNEATSYEVYRRTVDETTSTLVASVNTNKYYDTNVEAEMVYYYTVKALSDDNFSVMSDEVWTLVSNGHTGNYDNDLALYITERSYNTVNTNKISIKGVAPAPGIAKIYVNGVEKASATVANTYDVFSFENIEIKEGTNEVKIKLYYGTENVVEETLNYVYLTNYDMVVDYNSNEQYNVPRYSTVQDAINACDGTSKIIFVRNGEYNEQITVDKANVTIIGEDSKLTHIYYAVREGQQDTTVNNGTRYAFRVTSSASNFTAENLFIENSYEYKADGTVSNESAEAFYSEAANTMVIGCNLYSYQDTVQVKNNSNYFLRTKILGNVDFIWGVNCTALFEDCDIEFRYAANKNSGYVTAFNTSTVVFNGCRVYAEDSCGGSKYYLGRSYNNKEGVVVFASCYMSSIINKTVGWTDWSQNPISTNEDVYSIVFFDEYGTYGQGYAVNANRRQISINGLNNYLNKCNVVNFNILLSNLNTALSGTKEFSQSGTVTSEYNSNKYSQYEGNDEGLAKYNVEGYVSITDVTGGGLLKETSTNYYKVTTANEFLDAIAAIKASKGVPSVIEVMNDINLGYYEIDNASQYAANVLAKHNDALLSPTLMESGVSKVYIQEISNLTIFSNNGSTIKHAALDIKKSSNIIIRNIAFDELWEWDEATSGDYDVNDWDYMTIESGSTGVWIDHCTFYKAYDGVIDMKTDNANATEMDITVSWCEFMPGSKNNEFFNELMEYLDANKEQFPYYNSLLEDGMTKEQIWWYAYGQKKTHLLGQSDEADANVNLHVTFANNYYYNSMDRMPRVRYGTAHVYNVIMDAQELADAKATISNADVAKHIVSNGASSTCDAKVLVESSVIKGIVNALNSGNGSSPAGYINSYNTLYYLNGVATKLEVGNNNTQKDGAKILDVAEFIDALPYSYNAYDASALEELVKPYVGAGKLDLTTLQWEKTTYNDDKDVVTSLAIESKIGEGALETELTNNNEDIISKVFTTEEVEAINNGTHYNVILGVDKVEELNDLQTSLVTPKLNGFKIGTILDINLSKIFGSLMSPVTETGGNLELTVKLSNDLINSNSNVSREYKVLRIHDTTVDELDSKYDEKNNTLTFETDKFSVYVIAYNDVVTPDTSVK